MWIVKVIFLLFFIKFTKSNENLEVIGIIEDIIESNNALHVSYVNLLTSENYVQNSSINDFINELMRKLSKFKFVMRIDEKVVDRLFKKRILMTVIFIHSLDEFVKLSAKFTYFHFHYGGYYVVLFENAQDQDVQKIFKILWDLYIHNINLIRFVNESIIVETFMPFTAAYCNKTIPVQVAKYENGKFKFKPEDYFPKKFTNFFKCPISMASVTVLSPSILKREFSNGTFELYGRDIEMLKTLSNELNFYANNTYLHPFGSWGVMYPNKTMSGAMGMSQRRVTDFTIGNLLLKHDRIDIMDFCFTYSLDTLIFVIPRGKPYTPFHKLLRPFQDYVWFSILFVISACVVVITILSFLPQKYRDFVYGAKVTAPLLNVVNAIYGGAQPTLPKRNFARSILMMFLLFSLVIRSLYQGALFQFLQANDNQPEMQNIEEMAANNFIFYMIPSYDDMTKNNSAMKGKRVIIDPISDQTWMDRYMDKTLDYNFPGTILNSISNVLYFNKLKAHQKKPLLFICKQPFLMLPITMWFPKNSYLVEPINDKLVWYQSSGLVAYWGSNEEDYKYLNPDPENKGPQPLTFANLTATFQIWLLACGLSSVIFFVEIFLNIIKKFYNKKILRRLSLKVL